MSGCFSKQQISRRNGISVTIINRLATKYGWENQELTEEDREAVRQIIVDQDKVSYVGPLTQEEKLVLAANTLKNAEELVKRHKRVSGKAMAVIEEKLDQLIENKGKIVEEKFTGRFPNRTKEQILVDASPAINQLVSALAKLIPLERQAAGIDFGQIQPEVGTNPVNSETEDKLGQLLVENMKKQMVAFYEQKQMLSTQKSLGEYLTGQNDDIIEGEAVKTTENEG